MYPATPLFWRVWTVAKWFVAKATREKIVMVRYGYSNWLRCGFTERELRAWELPPGEYSALTTEEREAEREEARRASKRGGIRS